MERQRCVEPTLLPCRNVWSNATRCPRMRWKAPARAAFCLRDDLGLRKTGALGLAFELLSDGQPGLMKLIAAIRALGRHCDEPSRALTAIRAAIKQREFETRQILQHSTGERSYPIAD